MALVVTIRRATDSDNVALGEVMFDAVRNGRSEYSEVQRQAWVPEPREGTKWNERLKNQDIIVAEVGSQNRWLHESCAIGATIDFAYIRPTAQGAGLFRRLYQEIEALARQKEEMRLWVHARSECPTRIHKNRIFDH